MQQQFIVSAKQKALVLNPASPEMLCNLLPMAKPFPYRGHTLYAVPHDVDVVRLLRNVGVSAPSPIMHQYAWPCAFPNGPFPNQKLAAEFLTLHPRSFNLSQMGCVDATTEYLTPAGWKRIDQYDGGKVAQYHPDSREIEFVEPTEYVKLPCAQMIRFRSSTTDQLLSPEHRVLLYRDGHGHYVESAAVVALRHLLEGTVGEDLVDTLEGLVEFLPSDGRSSVTLEQSPDGFKYCFMVPSTFLVFRRNGCVFASGNTGKSVTTLWAFDYLRSVGKRKRMLVVAPLSTLERTWGDEIFKHFPHLSFAVLHGTAARRKKLLAHEFDVYIINHDGIEVVAKELYEKPRGGELRNLRPDIDVIAIDELAVFRNSGTDRYKALANLCADPERIVWGMTGTPIPNEPTDAWAQVRLVKPENVPKYFGQFRDQTMLKVSTYKYVAKKDSLETVHKAMQPAIRFTREDLPVTTDQTRHIALTPHQKKVYEDLRLRMKTEAEEGTVRAVNEADKLMKLIQVAAGAVYSTDGETVELDNSPRITEVKQIIEQAEGKVIVFVPFIAALHKVRDEVAKSYPTEMVYGGTSKTDRDTAFWRFQNLPATESRVLVANAAAMSHGLTLTEANTIVWVAPTVSHETFDQANHRIIRPGQERETFIIMLEGTDVERKIYARLKQKQTVQGLLLEAVSSSID